MNTEKPVNLFQGENDQPHLNSCSFSLEFAPLSYTEREVVTALFLQMTLKLQVLFLKLPQYSVSHLSFYIKKKLSKFDSILCHLLRPSECVFKMSNIVLCA